MEASFTEVERNWGAQTSAVLLLINICMQTVPHLGPEQISGTPQHRCVRATRSEMVGSCTGAWTACATGLHYWVNTAPALCRRMYLIFPVLLSTDLTFRHLKIYFSNSFCAGNKCLIFPDYKSANQWRKKKLLTLRRMGAQLCFVLAKLKLSTERKFSSSTA